MPSNVELLINYVQNEPSTWDTFLNSTEQEKELSWSKISDALGCQNGLHT